MKYEIDVCRGYCMNLSVFANLFQFVKKKKKKQQQKTSKQNFTHRHKIKNIEEWYLAKRFFLLLSKRYIVIDIQDTIIIKFVISKPCKIGNN